MAPVDGENQTGVELWMCCLESRYAVKDGSNERLGRKVRRCARGCPQFEVHDPVVEEVCQDRCRGVPDGVFIGDELVDVAAEEREEAGYEVRGVIP